MDSLLDLTSPWLYILIFVFALAEGAALIGLVLPGETSMLIGGFVVSQGSADAVLMYACGIGGSVIGDSIGYWVGFKVGPALRRSRLGQKIGDERWDSARIYLQQKGGRAVFFGRFASFLRTLVPPVAGQCGMPYRRFVTFNAPAAALWASIFLTLGVVAGNSWHVVENWTSRVSLLVAAAILLVIGYLVFTRWLARRRL